MTTEIRFQKDKLYRTESGAIVKLIDINTSTKNYPWLLCELVQNPDGTTPEIKSRMSYDIFGKRTSVPHTSDLMEEVIT